MKATMIAVVSLEMTGLTGLVLAQEKAPAGNAATNAAPSATASSPGKVQKGETLTVIGYLEKRDRVITIKSGPKGVVYTVTTKGGKVLFENLSAQQLRAQAPELHDFIKNSVAGDASASSLKRSGRADARLDASY